MASLRGKFDDNEETFVDTLKKTHPSKKHYRLDHVRLNKEIGRFDSDVIWVFGEDDSEIDTGINKNRWKFSDYDYNDEHKDGN